MSQSARTFPPADRAGCPSRRAVLAGVPSATVLAAVAAGPAAAAPDDYVAQAFKALAAYVVPGDDPYSAQQRVTAPRPGGVAAGTDRMLRTTYDKAIGVAVAPALRITAPGALGVALVVDLFARARYPVQSIAGPYAHPFANLRYAAKGRVLGDIDLDPLLAATPLGFAFGTPIALAAFGSYSEFGVYDPATRRLSGRPVGWDLARYDGVSDGWPELRGYWKGRTSVTDVAGLSTTGSHGAGGTGA
jgi:hypothetical protein